MRPFLLSAIVVNCEGVCVVVSFAERLKTDCPTATAKNSVLPEKTSCQTTDRVLKLYKIS